MSDIVEQDILKKRKDDQEELPVLTAQRFLNIFRQIHIFSDKKQKEFDEELRKLPSEVIMAMRGLPGAKLLLEHLDELKGISSVNDAISSATAASREAEEEIENAHQNIRMPFFQQQPVMQPMPVDNNFAEALSSSLSGAIERIENKRSAEIKSMLASVLTTQKAILDAQRNTLAPAVAPTSVSVDTGQIAQVLKDVIENQSKMFSDMIDTQTKTISNIVATSIKEQKPVIVEKPIYYPQPQASEPIAPAAPAKPLSEPISAIEEQVTKEENNFDTNFRSKKDKKDKKNKNKKYNLEDLSDLGDFSGLSPAGFDDKDNDFDFGNISNIADQPLDIENSQTSDSAAQPQESEPSPEDDDFYNLTNYEIEPESELVPNESSAEENSETYGEEFDDAPAENIPDSEVLADIKKSLDVPEDDVSATPAADDWSWDQLDTDTAAEKPATASKEVETATQNSDNDDDFAERDNSEPEPTSLEETEDNSWGYGESEEEPAQNDQSGEDDQDWEWEYEETPTEGASEQAEQTDENSGGQDWEWEYEEVPESQSAEQSDGNSDDQDWEWEYEEDNGENK